MSIPRASRGQPITATLINSIIDEINKNNLVSISGGSLNKSINGTTISVQPSAPQPAVAIIPPFYYSTVSTTASGVYFNLTAGTINNYLPDNIFNTVTLSTTTPALNEKRYVYLNCDTNGATILSAVVTASTVAPLAPTAEIGSAPVTFSALLYVIDGQTPYRVIGAGSLVARAVEVGRTGKTSIGVGEVPFNIYYTWAIFT